MHDELLHDELLVEDEIPQRSPGQVDLLLTSDAVAMEKSDMRTERRALGAEDGFAEAPEIALRIFDDQEQPGVRREPPGGTRDAQPKGWHRRSDRDQLPQVRRLVDDCD